MPIESKSNYQSQGDVPLGFGDDLVSFVTDERDEGAVGDIEGVFGEVADDLGVGNWQPECWVENDGEKSEEEEKSGDKWRS